MTWLAFVAMFGVVGAISLSYARRGVLDGDRIAFVLCAIACIYLAAHALVAFTLAR
jgi:hypothetical protein